jgi:sugar/nucleoside kinase (ribokinase family)
LHSLFLGVGADGLRIPQALPDVPSWFQCYDIVQLNADEIALIGGAPIEVAARAFGAGVQLLIVTLGEQGAVYFTTPSFTIRACGQQRRQAPGPIRTARIPPAAAADPIDPTGCGDVFGATMVSSLLREADVEDAIHSANECARRNLSYRGATHLHHHLRGEIVPR